MYKIIHVHSDHKFYHNLNRYGSDFFENTLLALGERSEVNILFQKEAIFFTPTKDNLQKIVQTISQFDIVIFANLTPFNREILLKLPRKIKVVWWFFGHEFYSTRLDLVLSNKTVNAVGNDYRVKEKNTLKEYYKFLKFRYRQIKNFYSYSQRIDAILMYSKEEHALVKKSLFFLPKLIIPSLQDFAMEDFKYFEKEDFIIHGHNRNMSNNHLDVLDIIKKSNNKKPFQMKMFLSYGIEQNYYKEVQKSISELPNIESFTSFLSKEEFNQTYKSASAFVLNSYRQIGLGNVFTAIRNNCKIYLNNKNVIKKWLINEGLLIFSIEDFKKDYENNNLRLTEEQARNNYKQFMKLINKNTNVDFQKNILKILQ